MPANTTMKSATRKPHWSMRVPTAVRESLAQGRFYSFGVAGIWAVIYLALAPR
jgi:hypothetical protein